MTKNNGGMPWRLWMAGWTALLLASCSTLSSPPVDIKALEQSGIASRHILDTVPFIAQEDLYCGPASLAMVVQYQGKNLSQPEAASMVYTPGRDGTFQHDMVAAMRRSGFLALPLDNLEDILASVHSGYPVLVFQNLGLSWIPFWHYAVVVGYDLSQNGLYLHSGQKKSTFTPFSTFHATWTRAGSWGYVAAPPDRWPAFADPARWLKEAAQLEHIGQQATAVTAYRTLLAQYPQNADAWFGLGNARMALNEHRKAEHAYRTALQHAPDHWPAHNNLAYALDELGRNKESCRLLENILQRAASRTDKAADAYRQQLAGTHRELCPDF